MPLLHTILATISPRHDANMPLLSEPWAIPDSASTRVVALRDELSLGVANSTARAIFFIGPFALGALFWGSMAELATGAKGLLRLADNARRGRLHGVEAAYGAATVCAIGARGAGLATLSVLIAYTHGAKDIGCGSWLRTLASMAATVREHAYTMYPWADMALELLPLHGRLSRSSSGRRRAVSSVAGSCTARILPVHGTDGTFDSRNGSMARRPPPERCCVLRSARALGSDLVVSQLRPAETHG